MLLVLKTRSLFRPGINMCLGDSVSIMHLQPTTCVQISLLLGCISVYTAKDMWSNTHVHTRYNQSLRDSISQPV